MINNLNLFNNFQYLNNTMPLANQQVNNANSFYNPFSPLNANTNTAQQPSFNFFSMFINLMFQMMQNFFNPVKNQPVPLNNAVAHNQNVNNAYLNNEATQNKNVNNAPKQQTALLPNNGKVLADFDFENGEVPAGLSWDSAEKAKIKPQVLQDYDGRKFFRMIATGEDKMYIPPEIKNRTRVQKCLLPPKPYQEGKKISYSVDVRFNDNFQGVFLGMFQYDYEAKTTKYGEKGIGTGNPLSFHRNPDGTTEIYNVYDNSNKSDRVNLGHIGEGKFVNIRLDATWSKDPQKGELIIYVDGKRAGRMAGHPTTLGQGTDTLPRVGIGAYGDNGNNQVAVDFDNFKITELN